jgi:hypothetical protein
MSYEPKNKIAKGLVADPQKTMEIYTQCGENLTEFARRVGLGKNRTCARRVIEHCSQTMGARKIKDFSPTGLLSRENAALRQKLQSIESLHVIVDEAIKSSVIRQKPVAPSYPKPKHAKKIDEETIILLLGDTQIGALVNPPDTMGLETYNWDIFVKRIGKYQSALDRIVNDILRTSYPVNDCIVIFLGDMVEGESIFKDQPFRLDRLGLDQVFEGGNQLAGLLSYIASMFRKVTVKCVSGNHGRVKGQSTLDMDYMLYRFMAMMLNDQPNMEFHISPSDIHGFSLPGEDHMWNLLAMHGHGIPMHHSLPFYGLEKKVGRVTDITKVIWDYVFIGHFHTDAEVPHAILNGSWVGGTEFTINKLTAVNRPIQRLFSFHPGKGLTHSYPVYLGKRPKLEQDKNGIYTPYDRFSPGSMSPVREGE